jgi:hypothetical protein
MSVKDRCAVSIRNIGDRTAEARVKSTLTLERCDDGSLGTKLLTPRAFLVETAYGHRNFRG